jgi:hypothetical protein
MRFRGDRTAAEGSKAGALKKLAERAPLPKHEPKQRKAKA